MDFLDDDTAVDLIQKKKNRRMMRKRIENGEEKDE